MDTRNEWIKFEAAGEEWPQSFMEPMIFVNEQ
jgi:hypothetical protein